MFASLSIFVKGAVNKQPVALQCWNKDFRSQLRLWYFMATCFLIVVNTSQWDVTCKRIWLFLLGIHYQKFSQSVDLL